MEGISENMDNKIVTDKNEMMALIEKYKDSINVNPLEFASEELRNDRDVVLKAANSHCYGLYYASEKLKNDREIALVAIKHNGLALSCLSEKLRNDKEIVLLAINNGIFQTLRYASEELKNDKEVVLTAVKKSGYALKYASDELKNDREIVLTAVKNDGNAFEYASEELRNDKEVVLEAIKRGGANLLYAGEKMQNDKDVVLQAVRLNEEAFEYASESLQNDPDVINAFKEWQKSKKISNLEIHDNEINKIIIVAKNEKDIDKISQIILKKYPKNTTQINRGTYKNMLYFEQSLESMYSIIDIGSIFAKLEKILKDKGIIISKLESNQTGMMQLEYYFGNNVKNKIYDNYNEYYNGRSLSYFDHSKNNWLKCLSEEVNFIVDIEKNNLTETEIVLLKSLNLI